RWNRADANLERRDAERLADLLVRVAKLLDKLGVSGLERERRELQVGADHGDLAAVLAGVLFIERGLDCVGLFLRQACGRGNQAAGACVVGKERRTVAKD